LHILLLLRLIYGERACFTIQIFDETFAIRKLTTDGLEGDPDVWKASTYRGLQRRKLEITDDTNIGNVRLS